MNPVSNEPVAVQVLAAVLVWAASRYGLHLSNEVALQAAGGAVVVLAPFVRQLVRPTASDPQPPASPDRVPLGPGDLGPAGPPADLG